MRNNLQEELESFLAKCAPDISWDNDDRLRLKEFLARLGKPGEVAKAIGVSNATLRWWVREEPKKKEKRPPPPADKIKKCGDLILERHFRELLKGTSPGAPSAARFYDV